MASRPGSRALLLFLLTSACGAEVGPWPGEEVGARALALTVSAKITPVVTGRLQTFLSTTLQPQAGDLSFFQEHPGGLTLLANRDIQHLHIQPHGVAIPLGGPGAWDFSNVDSLIQPVLPLGDQRHQYHFLAPGFLLSCDSSGCSLPTANFGAYTTYAQDVLRYYNAGGFTAGGHHYQSPSPIHLPYWAILDEPNINGFTGTRFAGLHNTVVPALLAVDPGVQIVGLEIDDFDGNDPTQFVKDFTAHVSAAARAPLAALGIHYYASCDQQDTDQDLLWETPILVQHLQNYRAAVAGSPLGELPIWLTESNVNADFDNGGSSNCQPGQPFVLDRRGSSAFFAAWRPYTFSQVVQAGIGVSGFFQFDYVQDPQYGELDQGSGAPYLSYWVDYWLDHYLGYRVSTGQGADLLSTTNNDAGEVEILAARRDADGSVVVMVANHAVRDPADNNGPGLPRTVALDLSALPAFRSATVLTIDKNTNPATGPAAVSVPPKKKMSLTLGGYGVSFLSLR